MTIIRLLLRHPVMASMRLALRLKSLSDKPSSTSVTSELATVLSLYNSFGLKDARRKRGTDYSMRMKGDVKDRILSFTLCPPDKHKGFQAIDEG